MSPYFQCFCYVNSCLLMESYSYGCVKLDILNNKPRYVQKTTYHWILQQVASPDSRPSHNSLFTKTKTICETMQIILLMITRQMSIKASNETVIFQNFIIIANYPEIGNANLNPKNLSNPITIIEQYLEIKKLTCTNLFCKNIKGYLLFHGSGIASPSCVTCFNEDHHRMKSKSSSQRYLLATVAVYTLETNYTDVYLQICPGLISLSQSNLFLMIGSLEVTHKQNFTIPSVIKIS